jgi:nucleoside-diphosphate-sugar epimerase
MRALVAGAGFLGLRVAALLADQGHDVFALRRHAGPLPVGVQQVVADLTVPGTLGAVPGDLDAVIFTASPDASSDSAYERLYVHGLTSLLAAPALKRSPPGRVLFTSSTAVYGQRRGEWVDEASPTEPIHFTGQRMLQAEQALAQATPTPIAVRLSGLYGPGRTGLLERLRRGTARYTAGHYTNRLHCEDAARALVHLAAMERPAPVYVGSDLEPAEQRIVYTWLAERLGAPAPALAPAGERTGRGSSKRCRPRALVASGFRFTFPSFREGYAPLLEGSPEAT